MKKWIRVKAEILELKAYPRSYGIVPIVKYEVDQNEIVTEVYCAYYSSGFIEKQIVDVMINPEKKSECIILSKKQLIKNICSIPFIITLLLGGTIYLLFVELKKHV